MLTVRKQHVEHNVTNAMQQQQDAAAQRGRRSGSGGGAPSSSGSGGGSSAPVIPHALHNLAAVRPNPLHAQGSSRRVSLLLCVCVRGCRPVCLHAWLGWGGEGPGWCGGRTVESVAACDPGRLEAWIFNPG